MGIKEEILWRWIQQLIVPATWLNAKHLFDTSHIQLTVLSVTLLPLDVPLHHIEPLADASVKAPGSPERGLAPLHQMGMPFPQLLGGVGFHRLHDTAGGQARWVLQKKMDVVLCNGHLDYFHVEISADLPDDALAIDGDPAYQDLGPEFRGEDQVQRQHRRGVAVCSGLYP
jgi:hypothetical protein